MNALFARTLRHRSSPRSRWAPSPNAFAGPGPAGGRLEVPREDRQGEDPRRRAGTQERKAQGKSRTTPVAAVRTSATSTPAGASAPRPARGVRVRAERDQHGQPRRLPLSATRRTETHERAPCRARLSRLPPRGAGRLPDARGQGPTVEQTAESARAPRTGRSARSPASRRRCDAWTTCCIDYGVRDVTMLVEEISD